MSNIIRWEPGREMSEMRSMLDRFFDDWRPFREEGFQSGSLALQLDIDEDDKAYTVRSNMPGLKPEDIRVRHEGEYLLIEGETHEDTQTGGDKKPLVRERRFGRYSRRIHLPEHIDVEHAEATYEQGVLTLTLPKAPGVEPKQIAVKAGNGHR